ncbi:MAG: carboxypeptidase-like regulatory domain-containing protein [Bacteroidota bacterium]
MKASSLLFFFGFLFCTLLKAQSGTSTTISGRVFSDDGDVAATHVLNITAQRATISDDNGFFSISAKLNDTLVFSAVQFKKKQVVVTSQILESRFLKVPMEEVLTQLDEVVVRPYSLSGDVGLDLGALKTDPVVTASSLGLPNANVRLPSKSERELFAATANPIMSFDPLINALTGRTKMLKQQVKRDKTYQRTLRVREFYTDSLFTYDLGIPRERIDQFMHFCEVDAEFQSMVDTHDRLKIWDYMRKKSKVYRQNNNLD